MSEQLTEPAYIFEKFKNVLISDCLKVFDKEKIDSLLACCFMKNMENLDKASLKTKNGIITVTTDLENDDFDKAEKYAEMYYDYLRNMKDERHENVKENCHLYIFAEDINNEKDLIYHPVLIRLLISNQTEESMLNKQNDNGQISMRYVGCIDYNDNPRVFLEAYFETISYIFNMMNSCFIGKVKIDNNQYILGFKTANKSSFEEMKNGIWNNLNEKAYSFTYDDSTLNFDMICQYKNKEEYTVKLSFNNEKEKKMKILFYLLCSCLNITLSFYKNIKENQSDYEACVLKPVLMSDIDTCVKLFLPFVRGKDIPNKREQIEMEGNMVVIYRVCNTSIDELKNLNQPGLIRVVIVPANYYYEYSRTWTYEDKSLKLEEADKFLTTKDPDSIVDIIKTMKMPKNHSNKYKRFNIWIDDSNNAVIDIFYNMYLKTDLENETIIDAIKNALGEVERMNLII